MPEQVREMSCAIRRRKLVSREDTVAEVWGKDVFVELTGYSARRASTGLTDAARRAGRTVEINTGTSNARIEMR
jgi:hypothetical protein